MPRLRFDFMQGTLSSSASDSTTSLTSAEFAGFPEVVGGSGKVIAITLDPGAGGAREIVHITAHSTAATTATVVRGREGTTAAAHASAVAWVHAPTAADFEVSHESPDMIQAWVDSLGPCTGYEFDNWSTDPPVGWSWVNQGGSTYREGLGAGVISMPSSGSSNAVRGIVMDVPSVPFSIEGKFSLTHNGANFQEAGLILRESSSGELALFTRLNTPSWVRSFWSDPSTFGSGSTIGAQQSESFYLRLVVNDWSNVGYYVSIDGVSWMTFATGVDVGATLTPDQIGFGGTSNASTELQPACHWLRVKEL